MPRGQTGEARRGGHADARTPPASAPVRLRLAGAPHTATRGRADRRAGREHPFTRRAARPVLLSTTQHRRQRRRTRARTRPPHRRLSLTASSWAAVRGAPVAEPSPRVVSLFEVAQLAQARLEQLLDIVGDAGQVLRVEAQIREEPAQLAELLERRLALVALPVEQELLDLVAEHPGAIGRERNHSPHDVASFQGLRAAWGCFDPA